MIESMEMFGYSNEKGRRINRGASKSDFLFVSVFVRLALACVISIFAESTHGQLLLLRTEMFDADPHRIGLGPQAGIARGPPRLYPSFMRRTRPWPGRLCLLSVSLLFVFVVAPGVAAELRAGLARIDITPAQPVMLAGYASRKELSQGVHDPLSARAVVFEHDHQRLVLVAVENCGFYNATAVPLRQAVLTASGLKPSELFLCATHTHAAQQAKSF